MAEGQEPPKAGRYLLCRAVIASAIALSIGLCGCVSDLRVTAEPSQPGKTAPSNRQGKETASDTGSPVSSAQSEATARLEAAIHDRINQIRKENGLQPLQSTPRLQEIARAYSRRMARERFFSHSTPEGTSLADRVGASGLHFRVLGENIFQTVNVPEKRLVQTVVQGWMNSPGHRKNILRPEFAQTGLGVWRDGKTYLFTQEFFTPL